MDDRQLIALYNSRSETAITESDKKYGKYLRYIANNILRDLQDTEECVSDTYLSAWNTIPPQNPSRLSTYLGKITRNLALDRYRVNTAEKRGGGQVMASLSELSECIGQPDSCDNVADGIVLANALNGFLAELQSDDRKIFVQRYWYFCQVNEIAEDLGMSQSKVKMSLLRSSNKLRQLLEKEGVAV